MESPRTIVFLGKSGSGKDTQAKLLEKKLEPVLYVSTGDLFRAIAEKETVMGRKTKEILGRGGLMPHWFASFLTNRFLSDKLKDKENLIFPSSPRTLPEAKELDEVIRWLGRSLPEAVFIDVPDNETEERLLKRGRYDDNKEDIRARLGWFTANVGPAIEYYKKEGRLHTVNGVGKVEDIHQEIKKALKIDD